MTNLELRTKLEAAQLLLSDVYHWAETPMSNGLQVSPFKTNAEVASQMSVADSCIIDALEALEWDRGIE
jgi:hypothetical protein